ncbi:MAG: hypothetical protein HY047_00570 [Acidobacteria bacterium]|nr:hypothetical protein [Acidobacteriota bacterium]
MKGIAGPLVVAVVLAVAGAAFWTMGQTDQRLADVHKQLATLRFVAAGAGTEGVEQALGVERRLPVVGQEAVTDVRDVRATSAYWRSDYTAIAPQKDAGGIVTDTDPTVVFLAANAAFRASQTSDRNESLRRLDTAVKSYADVLKNSPGHMDAAYNFEYAVRTRDALAHPKPGARTAALAAAPKPAARDEQSADLPSGPTLHGRPGGPPPAANMSQFKIVIPKRGEERKDAPDAGKGGAKIRKG